MSDPSDFCIGCINDEYPEGLRIEVESQSATIDSLRQQLAELQEQAIKDVNHFRKVAAESQAREKAMFTGLDEHWLTLPENAWVHLPANSTALDSECKYHYELGKQQARLGFESELDEERHKAKREALLEAVGLCKRFAAREMVAAECADAIRRMADNINKGD